MFWADGQFFAAGHPHHPHGPHIVAAVARLQKQRLIPLPITVEPHHNKHCVGLSDVERLSLRHRQEVVGFAKRASGESHHRQTVDAILRSVHPPWLAMGRRLCEVEQRPIGAARLVLPLTECSCITGCPASGPHDSLVGPQPESQRGIPVGRTERLGQRFGLWRIGKALEEIERRRDLDGIGSAIQGQAIRQLNLP